MTLYVLGVLLFFDLIATIVLDSLLLREGVYPSGIFMAGASTVSLLVGYTFAVWQIARLNGHKHGFRAGMVLMADANGGEDDIDRAEAYASKQSKIRVVDE